MRITARTSDEQGVALVTALLAVLLASALMAGMFAALTADQRSHAVVPVSEIGCTTSL